MSYTRASIIRWFEEIAEKTIERLKPGRGLSPASIASRLANIGDTVFPWISHAVDVLSRRLNVLQLTMIESMILASLWFGAIALLLAIATMLTG
ncbi:hypothetical protein [Desulfurococcus mucosus]|uniref:Uncharacterized protein n=1 Tax=Desulfurococcus mucosus (strain ATCC 35584 / DSM 2162 / JCM 9187 / O7/1) TaxID=765177 RepID=E8RAG6_DESM0|nr:hypothetical protein [Desulfurococcus mucosus]ADV64376.1 hypothetical protein Desmu_0057 [Desulfurococcus mucosus DSM 2162]